MSVRCGDTSARTRVEMHQLARNTDPFELPRANTVAEGPSPAIDAPWLDDLASEASSATLPMSTAGDRPTDAIEKPARYQLQARATNGAPNRYTPPNSASFP